MAANQTNQHFLLPPTYSAPFSIFCNLVLFLLEELGFLQHTVQTVPCEWEKGGLVETAAAWKHLDSEIAWKEKRGWTDWKGNQAVK